VVVAPSGNSARAAEHPAVFVVGVARSGTTLLRLQLDSHPELAIPPETGFGALLTSFGERPIGPDGLLDALAGLPTWPDLGIDRAQLGAAFAELDEWNAGAGLRAYYRAYAAMHGKARWGDKTPGNIAHMPALANAFPEARFIHIIRDGRDVAASLRGLPFAPGDGSVAAVAAHWRDSVDRAQRAGATLPHYREVRYETLVTDPEATLRGLCDFAELAFDPAMLRAHEGARDRLAELRSVRLEEDGFVRLPDNTRVRARTLGPPDPARVGRWREALTEHDVVSFEALAGGALSALGYEPSYSAPSRTPRSSAGGSDQRDKRAGCGS
jgi:hypothetical protein